MNRKYVTDDSGVIPFKTPGYPYYDQFFLKFSQSTLCLELDVLSLRQLFSVFFILLPRLRRATKSPLPGMRRVSLPASFFK